MFEFSAWENVVNGIKLLMGISSTDLREDDSLAQASANTNQLNTQKKRKGCSFQIVITLALFSVIIYSVFLLLNRDIQSDSRDSTKTAPAMDTTIAPVDTTRSDSIIH